MDDRRRAAAQVLVADVSRPEPDAAVVHHLRRVLRLREDEAVTVTDGAGAWRPCRLVGDDLEPAGEVEHEPAPARPVMLAVATPKGERADWLVQKCTEIGVDRIVLLAADRSVVRWTGDRAARHVERLRRVAVEAAMQSRRVWVPEITGPLPAGQVLVDAAVAEPGGRPLGAGDSLVAVGPEGGWTAAELGLAADTVSLGPHVLRVETAAVVAVTLMVAHRAVVP